MDYNFKVDISMLKSIETLEVYDSINRNLYMLVLLPKGIYLYVQNRTYLPWDISRNIYSIFLDIFPLYRD